MSRIGVRTVVPTRVRGARDRTGHIRGAWRSVPRATGVSARISTARATAYGVIARIRARARIASVSVNPARVTRYGGPTDAEP